MAPAGDRAARYAGGADGRGGARGAACWAPRGCRSAVETRLSVRVKRSAAGMGAVKRRAAQERGASPHSGAPTLPAPPPPRRGRARAARGGNAMAGRGGRGAGARWRRAWARAARGRTRIARARGVAEPTGAGRGRARAAPVPQGRGGQPVGYRKGAAGAVAWVAPGPQCRASEPPPAAAAARAAPAASFSAQPGLGWRVAEAEEPSPPSSALTAAGTARDATIRSDSAISPAARARPRATRQSRTRPAPASAASRRAATGAVGRARAWGAARRAGGRGRVTGGPRGGELHEQAPLPGLPLLLQPPWRRPPARAAPPTHAPIARAAPGPRPPRCPPPPRPAHRRLRARRRLCRGGLLVGAHELQVAREHEACVRGHRRGRRTAGRGGPGRGRGAGQGGRLGHARSALHWFCRPQVPQGPARGGMPSGRGVSPFRGVQTVFQGRRSLRVEVCATIPRLCAAAAACRGRG
jgi:hypothetical protein